jgi:hypothetical protein
LQRHAQVWVDDWEIPRENWQRVMPRAGSVVSIRLRPHGDQFFRTLLTIGIFAAAAALSLYLPLTPFGAALVASAIGIGGALALNALIPPPSQKLGGGETEDPVFSISSSRNGINQFGYLPLVLGKMRVVPPFGARPFTEIGGRDQFLRQLVIWGYGKLDVTDIKIGETAIAGFSDVEHDIIQGDEGDQSTAYYTRQVSERQLNIDLISQVDSPPNDSLSWPIGVEDDWTDTLTTEECDWFSVDYSFFAGLVRFNSDGKPRDLTCAIEVRFAREGQTVWTNQTRTVKAASQRAVRGTILINVVNNRKYDVQMRRRTPNHVLPNQQSDVQWTALRSINIEQPVNMTGLAKSSFRIRASERFNRVVDQINAVCQSMVKDYDGTPGSWTVRATSNPASLFRAVLQGAGNARPLTDSQIDLDALEDWHDYCVANGFEYNGIVQSSRSVYETLADVASAGRASPTLLDGKWSVVIDQVKTTVVQHFTPRNITSFQAEKVFRDRPHALRIQFQNAAEGYEKTERIVYDDGYNEDGSGGLTAATEFETLQLPGITSPEEAWKHGRYHIAVNRLRPEVYTLQADVEHIACTRGDLVRVTHDVPLWGLGYGRIVTLLKDAAGDTIGLVLDTKITMASGTNVVRVRKSDGTTLVQTLVTNLTPTTRVDFTVAVAAASSPQPGDLFQIGLSDNESADLVVKSIQPGQDLTAEIKLVDYSPGIFTADTGPIPDYDPQITPPPEIVWGAPPVPTITSVIVDELALYQDASGNLRPSAIINFSTLKGGGTKAEWVEGRFRPVVGDSDLWEYISAVPATDGVIVFRDVFTDTVYDFEIRSVSGDSRASDWQQRLNVRVLGASGNPPDDVANFIATVIGTNVFLKWSRVDVIDLKRYEIRFHHDITTPPTASWNNAIPLTTIPATSTTAIVPAAIGTYFIRACDISGQLSVNTTYAQIFTIDAAELDVQSWNENPTWPGVKTDVTLDSNAIILSSGKTSGTYNLAIVGDANDYVDLGAVFTVRVQSDVLVAGETADFVMADWTPLSSVATLSGTEADAWDFDLQIRTTDNDPADSPTWSAWRRGFFGDFKGRAFQWRAQLSAENSATTPRVSILGIHVGLFSRQEQGTSFTVTGGSQSVSFATAFYQTPALSVSIRNGVTGDYSKITAASRTGFTVETRDNADALKALDIDWIAIGYGAEVSSATASDSVGAAWQQRTANSVVEAPETITMDKWQQPPANPPGADPRAPDFPAHHWTPVDPTPA